MTAADVHEPRTGFRWSWVGYAVIAVAVVAIPLMNNAIELRQQSRLILALLAVLGVNMCIGYGGLISLGHGVFIGVGAFGTAYFVDDMSMPWPLAILGGTLVAGLAGCLIGLPALRIRGIHLALVTLGLAIVFRPLLKRIPAITGAGGDRSVEASFDAPSWFGDTRYANSLWQYCVVIAVCLLGLLLMRNIVDSRMGRAMRAVRDNDTAAAVYGVNLTQVKVLTFGISAAFAGAAGAVEVTMFPFVSQDNFEFTRSLNLYAAAVIGGLGSLWGAVLGTSALSLVPRLGNLLDNLDGLPLVGWFFALLRSDTFVFGTALVLLTFLAPGGLSRIRRVPSLAPVRAWFKRRYTLH